MSALAGHAADWNSRSLLARGTAELLQASPAKHKGSQASGFPAAQMAQNHHVSEGEKRFFIFKGLIPVFTGVRLYASIGRDGNFSDVQHNPVALKII